MQTFFYIYFIFKIIMIACNKINVQLQENKIKELQNAFNIKELQVADSLI